MFSLKLMWTSPFDGSYSNHHYIVTLFGSRYYWKMIRYSVYSMNWLLTTIVKLTVNCHSLKATRLWKNILLLTGDGPMYCAMPTLSTEATPMTPGASPGLEPVWRPPLPLFPIETVTYTRTKKAFQRLMGEKKSYFLD
jgi:hypothetical protein